METVLTDKLHWLGHSGFRWDGTRTVYFDPYKIPDHAKKADLILVSHEHFDHCSKPDIKRIAGEDTLIIANADAARELKAARIRCRDVHAMAPGEKQALGALTVRAVPAYNTNKQFHPKASGKVGFVVTMDGMTVYHAGDTDLIPEMAGIDCDVALLPVGGTYTMTAGEAAQAALMIRPKEVVPMHYGEVVGSPADAATLRDLLKGKIGTRILKKES